MRKVVLFLAIFPVACFALEYEFKLHLPCGPNDMCAQFESDSGPVSLRKEPEIVIGESNLISVDIVHDEFDRPELSLRMKPEVAKKFTAITEKAIGNFIAIVIGTKVVSQPSVIQKIESENILISTGIGEEPFWSNIPWIKSKVDEKRKAIREENNRSVIIYAGIGFSLLLAALWFVFGRKK